MSTEKLYAGTATISSTLIGHMGTSKAESKALILFLLIEHIGALKAAPEALILLEEQPQQVVGRGIQRELLSFAHFSEMLALFREKPESVARYTTGRIFHKDFEVRWEQYESEVYIAYLGLEKYLPENVVVTHTLDLSKYNVQEDTAYYLFGKRLGKDDLERIGPPAREGDFAEVRIPRLLRYPMLSHDAQNMQRRKLVVRRYLERDTGSLVAFRFVGLKGAV